MEKKPGTVVINDSLFINPEDLEKWNSLTKEEQENFSDIAPW